MKRRFFAACVLLVCLMANAAIAESFLPVRKTFLVRIDGDAMQPTLADGETARVSSEDYDENEPARGDVIIYRRLGREGYALSRIIAIPGDTIEIRDGHVLINGEPIEEAYVSPENNRYTRDLESVTMDDGEYYLLGDNRDDSYDSRILGPVLREQIVAHVKKVILPLTRMRPIE